MTVVGGSVAFSVRLDLQLVRVGIGIQTPFKQISVMIIPVNKIVFV
jgi:hypothetical protein